MYANTYTCNMFGAEYTFKVPNNNNNKHFHHLAACVHCACVYAMSGNQDLC